MSAERGLRLAENGAGGGERPALLSVSDAQSIMLRVAGMTECEEVDLDDARGRVLRAPIRAQRDQPPFAAAAMDGYALRALDTPGALRIVGESAAGRPFNHSLPKQSAVRISTGAPLPAGADTILPFESVCAHGDVLHAGPLPPGKHVRARASDYGAGDVLVPAGTRLGVGEIALAASAGFARMSVSRQPRIAVFAGGDELVTPGGGADDAQIHDSASFAVAALIREWGGAPSRQALLPDRADRIGNRVRKALSAFDAVIIIGGASVGRHDHAQAACAHAGADCMFSKVNVKPGKPVWCAVLGGKLILGLPGNPVAALVCGRLFLAPLLARMQGLDSAVATEAFPACVDSLLPSGDGRETYLRGALFMRNGKVLVRASAGQDSANLSSFAASNILIARAPYSSPAAAGDLVRCLSWLPR